MSKRSLALLAAVVLVAAGLGWLALRTDPVPAVVDDVAPAASSVATAPSALAADLAAPGAATTQSDDVDERTTARVDAQAAGADAFAGATWVEGLVRFPPDTPRGERAFVHARGRKLGSAQEHRFEIGADGRFRAAFAPKTRKGWLRVEGRFLFTESSLEIDPTKPPPSIVLEPKVGGCLRVTLVPSSLAMPRIPELAAARGQAQGHYFEGRNPSQRGARAENGVLEFGGLDPEVAWWVTFRLDGLEAKPMNELRPKAGEVVEREVQVTLAATLSGVVRDESGVPVDGARMLVSVDESWRPGSDMPTTTKDGGKFSVTCTSGKVVLSATKAGYLQVEQPAIEVVEGFVKSDVELVIDRGLTVRGRVRWPDGAPAADATVEGFSESSHEGVFFGEPGRTTARAQADGTFELTGFEAGPVAVSARAKRANDGESKLERVDWTARLDGVEAGTAGVELVLESGTAVRGRVVDDLGAPVEAFRVRVQPIEPDASGRRAVSAKNTDDDGRFEIPTVPDGAWEVVASQKTRESGRVPIAMPADAARELTLVLPRAARISGRVLDPSGQPRADARIEVRARTDEWNDREVEPGTKSDASGAFAVDVRPGAVKIHAQGAASAPAVAIERELMPGQHVEGLTLQLRRGGTIEGIVRDAADRPRQGVTVHVNSMNQSNYVPPLSTAADGSFRAENVCPGQVWLHAQGLDGEDGVQKQVDVVDGQVVQVQLGGRPRGALVVTGTVRAKEPIAGVRVSFWAQKSGMDDVDRNRQAKTDANGRYEILLAAPGTYSISASPEGYADVQRSLEIGDAPGTVVDFDLPAGRIAGRVIGPDGKPVTGVNVHLNTHGKRSTPGTPGSQGQEETKADGSFAFEGVQPGSYQLRADVDGWSNYGQRRQKKYAPARLTGIEVALDGARDGLEIRLTEGSTILARVLAPDGRPAANAIVTCTQEGARETGTTDAAGVARIEGLAAGDARLSARSATTTTSQDTTITVRTGDPGEATLQLVPGTILAVKLVDRSGQTLSDPTRLFVSVTDVRKRRWDHNWGESRAAGTLRFGPLPDGDYEVLVKFGADEVRNSVHVSGGTEREFVVREPQ